jgi:PPOX class probable F420-dependent enzyme
VALHPGALPPAVLEFLRERHLATLTTIRTDGSPHTVPVGFTWDEEALLARVIASRGSAKVRQARAGRPASLCQVDRRRWLTLEGRTGVLEDDAAVRDAEERYARRYRVPRPNPERVVVVLRVDRVLGGSWPDPLPASPYGP